MHWNAEIKPPSWIFSEVPAANRYLEIKEGQHTLLTLFKGQDLVIGEQSSIQRSMGHGAPNRHPPRGPGLKKG